jgi:hypothetical protein
MERKEIEDALVSCHGDREEELYGADRIVAGAYVKGEIRITFYYKPSFYSRMKMYWIFGWSWEDIDKG